MPELYFRHNGLSRSIFPGRTLVDERQFTFALWEMSRIYAFSEVNVMVLPQEAEPSRFPEGSGAALLRNGDRVQLVGQDVRVLSGAAEGMVISYAAENGNGEEAELAGLQTDLVTEPIHIRAGDASASMLNTCAWGRVNPDPYWNRGWCCSEFTIALFNGTISNLRSPEVRSVQNRRRWPTSVAEYDSMMTADTDGDGRHDVQFTKR